MDTENIRDNIAEQLGYACTTITSIIESQSDNYSEQTAISCDDDIIVLLMYARGFTEAAFSFLERLNNRGGEPQ